MKEEIALVVQVEPVKVNEVLRAFQKQQKMHAMLRQLKENGEPLPKTVEELQYAYLHSDIEFRDRKGQRTKRYARRSRRQTIRFIKFNKF